MVIKPLSLGLEMTEVLGMKLWAVNKRTDYEDKWENLLPLRPFSKVRAVGQGLIHLLISALILVCVLWQPFHFCWEVRRDWRQM